MKPLFMLSKLDYYQDASLLYSTVPRSIDGGVDDYVTAQILTSLIKKHSPSTPFFAIYQPIGLHYPCQQTSSFIDIPQNHSTPYQKALYLFDQTLSSIVETLRKTDRLRRTIILIT